MVNLKLISRTSLGVSLLIFLVYFGERVSASSLVPIDLYSIPPIHMFVTLLVMSAFVATSFMIEKHLATE